MDIGKYEKTRRYKALLLRFEGDNETFSDDIKKIYHTKVISELILFYGEQL